MAPLTDARTAAELAAGLPSLFGAFRAVLDYPAGLRREEGRNSVLDINMSKAGHRFLR